MLCHRPTTFAATAVSLCFSAVVACGQLNDVTQTPNTENAGIQKSLEDEVGTSQGDAFQPDSSTYIIKRDPFRSIRRGRQIFQRKFTVEQGLGPRTNDGVGDLDHDGSLAAGLADSCALCHGRPRGSAGFGGNVFTRPDSRDAPHLFGLGLQEMLADEMTTALRAIRDAAIADATGAVVVDVECGENGVILDIFRGRFSRIPELDGREADETRIVDGFQFRDDRQGRNVRRGRNDVALRYSAWLRIDDAGEYTFRVAGRRAFQLAIDDTIVVDSASQDRDDRGSARGKRSRRVEETGVVALDAGMHHIVFVSLNSGPQDHVSVGFAAENASFRSIPESALFTDCTFDDRDENGSVTRGLIANGVNFGTITAHPDGTVSTADVEGVNEDLRIRPFFAEGSTISIREFVVGAFNAEMGLEAPDPMLTAAASGGSVVTPSGMVLDGGRDAIEPPPVSLPNEDSDGDGVVNEIDPAIVDHMEFYLLNYFKPGTYEMTRSAKLGQQRMEQFACTTCHVPTMTIKNDRRVADVETVFDPENGIFNGLFATAEARFVEVDDTGGTHPSLKEPGMGEFVVERIYTDFKRHDLGPAFWERNFDGTLTKAFVTEPLWGVGSTPPYGHDGRSINLREVIIRHGGEAQASTDAFLDAPAEHQEQLIAYLESLVLFPPDDTASNLNPGDETHPDFPQRGHGSINLSVLFNDPADLE